MSFLERRARGTHGDATTYCFVFLIIVRILPVNHRNIEYENCWVTFAKYLVLVRHVSNSLSTLAKGKCGEFIKVPDYGNWI